MENLQKVNRLSSFFMEKNEDKMAEIFKEFQEKIRETLELPDDIKLTGLTFDRVEEKEFLDCIKTCYTMVNGQLTVYCCRP